MTIRVFLAEDQPIMILGLRQALSCESDIEVAGTVEESSRLFEAVRYQKIDILILGLSTTVTDGLELLRRLRIDCRDIRVLVVSACGGPLFATRALQLGAAGYLSKRCAPAELVRAIRKIHRGNYYLDEGAVFQVARALKSADTPEQQPHETLSEREWQLFYAIAEGMRPTEIANRLHISVKTVSAHRRHVLEKLGLQTNADLVRYALRMGLISM